MDPFSPGAERAGEHFSATALVTAMVRVESAWVAHDLPAVTPEDLAADDVAAGGNPVIPLVRVLRARSGDDAVHRGLTSQDVLDTALMLLARDAVAATRERLEAAMAALATLAIEHRGTAMVARTLTQHAVPTTFGLRASGWLTGLADARDDLAGLAFPVQLGGAGGTNAAAAALRGDPRAEAHRLAHALGLDDAPPWHTRRRPVTRIGDALVATADACGRIANDVVTATRPEIGELAEGAPGGSSTMPHKRNPVLSVLIRSAAIAAPPLGATLHLAAAGQVDERADGAWHAEWPALRDLARRVVVAADQCVDLVTALEVRADRMAANLARAGDDVLAEQRALTGTTTTPADYLGQADHLITLAVERAQEPPR